jgi:hypothetical protein
MRGLDPRIHAIVGAASSRCVRVDGRNKSGHDNLEWRKRHCVFGSARIGNFPDTLRAAAMAVGSNHPVLKSYCAN